jgi:hypothetical protein
MALFRRILSLGKRGSIEQEIEAELREHMAMCVDDNMAQGMSREEAERDARRRFGSPAAMRERVTAEDAAVGLESLWHDVRGALRIFLRSPNFSLVVVATLALGIGANTAIFEILNAVRLRTLPITKPGELVELRIADGNPTGIGVKNSAFTDFTMPMWQEVKEHRPVVRNLCLGHRRRHRGAPRPDPPCEWSRGHWRVLQRAWGHSGSGTSDRTAG